MTIFSIQDFTCTDLGHHVLKSPQPEHDLNDDERQVLALIAQYHTSDTQQQKQLHLKFDSMYEHVNLTRLVVLKMLNFNGVPHTQQPNLEKDKLVNLSAALAVLSNYHPQSSQTNNSTSHTNKTNRSVYSDTTVVAHSIVHTINAMASQSDMDIDDEFSFDAIVQDMIMQEQDNLVDNSENMADEHVASHNNIEDIDNGQIDNEQLASQTKQAQADTSQTDTPTTAQDEQSEVDPMLRFVAEFAKEK